MRFVDPDALLRLADAIEEPAPAGVVLDQITLDYSREPFMDNAGLWHQPCCALGHAGYCLLPEDERLSLQSMSDRDRDNLIVDPLMALLGYDYSRWPVLRTKRSTDGRSPVNVVGFVARLNDEDKLSLPEIAARVRQLAAAERAAMEAVR